MRPSVVSRPQMEPIPAAAEPMKLLVPVVLALSVAVVASPADAARVALLLSSKVSEYEEALKGLKDATPHEIVAVYDMDGDPERGQVVPPPDLKAHEVNSGPRVAGAPRAIARMPSPASHRRRISWTSTIPNSR